MKTIWLCSCTCVNGGKKKGIKIKKDKIKRAAGLFWDKGHLMLLIITLEPFLLLLSFTAVEVYYKTLLLLLICFTCMALSPYSWLFFFLWRHGFPLLKVSLFIYFIAIIYVDYWVFLAERETIWYTAYENQLLPFIFFPHQASNTRIRKKEKRVIKQQLVPESSHGYLNI